MAEVGHSAIQPQSDIGIGHRVTDIELQDIDAEGCVRYHAFDHRGRDGGLYSRLLGVLTRTVMDQTHFEDISLAPLLVNHEVRLETTLRGRVLLGLHEPAKLTQLQRAILESATDLA